VGALTLMKKSHWSRLVLRMAVKSIFHLGCQLCLILLFKVSMLSVLTDQKAKVLPYMPGSRGTASLILNLGTRWMLL
jgi:hypothetical protein